jgi:hypothetical protein
MPDIDRRKDRAARHQKAFPVVHESDTRILTEKHISTHWLQQVVAFIGVIPAETIEYKIHAFGCHPALRIQ